jgi:16S rRNA (cytidine1402-2'-O)-methyltransferase
VFYESPHQVLKTLGELQTSLGERQAVIGRELTKIHEEFIRGTLTELSGHFRQNRPRGEFTVMVAGNSGETAGQAATPPELSDEVLRQEVQQKVASGANKKDAIKMTASQWGLSRRKVYQLMLEPD